MPRPSPPGLPASLAATATATLLLLLLLASSADAAAANTAPATSSTHGKGGKGGSSLSPAACVAATGVPGCSRCALSGKRSKRSGSGNAGRYTCTRCAGEGYETIPIDGLCVCGEGYGRPSGSPVVALASASAPAHGKSSKGGNKNNNNTPIVVYETCAQCPDGTVSGSYNDACVACAAGYEPYGKASCIAACAPSSCTDLGAACGLVDDGCEGILECGACPGEQTCDPSSNVCSCPDGATPGPDGSCLSLLRIGCVSDGNCGSGLCQNEVCYAVCPANSEPKADGDGCVCSANSYGKGGEPPCAPCGEGSSTPTPGCAECNCEPPRTWNAALNECACPRGTAFVNDECRKVTTTRATDGDCASDDECASALCVGGTCSQRGCPDGTAPSGTTGCLCGPGTWSETGETPCEPCGDGASSADYGSMQCSCTAPTGSVWSPPGSCSCPPDQVDASGTCLLRNGEDCIESFQCASAICDVQEGKCIAECPPHSTATIHGCVCDAEFFGYGGFAPCSPCPSPATTDGRIGQSFCSCPDGKGEWSSDAESCVCAPGQEASEEGDCLIGDLRLCDNDAQCAHGYCEASTGVCLDGPSNECPINSQPDDVGTGCVCLPGFFGDDGRPGGDGCNVCGEGSHALENASGCECETPIGSTWVASSNTCDCAPSETAVNGQCLTIDGGDCEAGDDCASGICAGGAGGGSCVAACPAFTVVEGGSCVCAPGSFGPDGGPQCAACGDGATNTGTGNTACRCSPATGEIWVEQINRCECPVNQELAGGVCRGIDGETCDDAAGCVSSSCVLKTCRSACVSPTVIDGSGNCVCPRDTYSATGGGPTCTPCGPGAKTDSSGATACFCETPLGSTWSSGSNTCTCPVGKTAVNKICKTSTGGDCFDGSTCASGLCDGGKCVAACPAGSEIDGAGGCRCKSGFFGPGDGTPCVACGPGATSAAGRAFCTCPTPATWQPSTNTCTCAAGFTFSNGKCTCLATTCSPLCPGATSPTCPSGQACEKGQCLPTTGNACVNDNGHCGICYPNCGNTLAQVCARYGFPTDNKNCGISAKGGGGRCAGTSICCIVDYPMYVIPSPTDGTCKVKPL